MSDFGRVVYDSHDYYTQLMTVKPAIVMLLGSSLFYHD